MNAYELADQLDEAADELESEKIFAWEERTAATMLRQQADRIAELESLYWQQVYKNIPAQTKPLSDDEIFKLGSKLRISTTEIECNWHPVVLEFARAIEERHGIK